MTTCWNTEAYSNYLDCDDNDSKATMAAIGN